MTADDLTDAKCADAAELLGVVDQARGSARELLNPSAFDTGMLLIAQAAAIVVAIGHTDDETRDVVLRGLVAVALIVTAWDWHRGLTLILIALFLGVLAYVGRKQLFGKTS